MLRKVVLAILLCCCAGNSFAMRVVSVGGGLTEIIYALGAQETLVGVDTTSVYPQAAQTLPQVGYMRALSVEGVLSLKPDVIVLTQDAGPPHSIKAFQEMGLKVVTLNQEASVAALYERIDTLANLFDKKKQGEKLKKELTAQQKQLEKILAKQTEKKKALFILSHAGNSLSIAGQGTAADSVLKLAGLENVAEDFQGYRMLGQEGVMKLNPDVIITTTQGVEAWGSAEKILAQSGVQHTRAAQNNQLHAMEAMYLLGFGPRVISAALELNQHIYP